MDIAYIRCVGETST